MFGDNVQFAPPTLWRVTMEHVGFRTLHTLCGSEVAAARLAATMWREAHLTYNGAPHKITVTIQPR